MPRFSVIIPCYHDEDKLADLLRQLQQLPDSSLEIIVVDGARDPACGRVCQQYEAQWLVAEPCRGQQLRMGAAVAKGDALWFLHADNRLPADPLSAMQFAFDQGSRRAKC